MNRMAAEGAAYEIMNKTGKLTIREIAEMAHVSKTTVSFYLNGKTDKMSQKTRDKIEKIIQETKYEPNAIARSLSNKQSNLIGIIIGDITNNFSNKIVKGINDACSASQYQMILGNSNYDEKMEEKYVEQMLQLGVEGFIVQPSSKFRPLYERIKKAGVPLVFFDSKLYDSTSCWVKTDSYEACYQAVSDCAKMGYNRFLLIAAEPKLLSTRIERASGFYDAVSHRELPYEFFPIEANNVDQEAVRKFVQKQIIQNPDDKILIFVPNCWALNDVFEALFEFRGRIPDKLGILGYDNWEWTNMCSPRLSTIVQPAYEEGQRAFRILMDQMNHKHIEDERQTLNNSIIWRESTMHPED